MRKTILMVIILVFSSTLSAKEISFEEKIRSLAKVQKEQKEYIREIVAKKTKILEQKLIQVEEREKKQREKNKVQDIELEKAKGKVNSTTVQIKELEKKLETVDSIYDKKEASLKEDIEEQDQTIKTLNTEVENLKKRIRHLEGIEFDKREEIKKAKRYKYKGRFIINNVKIAILESKDKVLRLKEGENISKSIRLSKVTENMCYIYLEKSKKEIGIKKNKKPDQEEVKKPEEGKKRK